MHDQANFNRRRFLKVTAGLAGGLLAARCAPPTPAAPAATATSAAPAASPTTAAPKIGGTINMLGWEGYDIPDAAKSFQDANGITLNVTYIGSNDEVLTKFQAGGPGRYDLGDINSRFIQPMIDQNMLMPLDESKLPNLADLYPAFHTVGWARRDGKPYAVPAYFGFDVINYNADLVKEAPKTWEVLLDPQYKGKVGFYDNPTGTMLLIGVILGFSGDGSKYTPDQLSQIVDWGKRWKANSKTIVKSYGEMADLLVRGDIWLGAIGWEYVTVLGRQQGANLAHALPDGPAKAWTDAYFIFNGANNVDTSYAWINNAISPEAMAISGPALSSLVTNSKASAQMPSEHVEAMGYGQLDQQLSRAEFTTLPPAETSDANQITLDQLLQGYEEIKAA